MHYWTLVLLRRFRRTETAVATGELWSSERIFRARGRLQTCPRREVQRICLSATRVLLLDAEQ